ncbi:lauroyl acyltransferase [uncultured Cohaesibacter sp.]|uniref:lysophospholipid acyltransferase family protein n=1 Tax=uncultured Cohaesibacter sp. TaxID=1002546 RepID=UPI00292CF653|nr:lauroyl acyltransferase [uncultured Cohaesibacter sp.]
MRKVTFSHRIEYAVLRAVISILRLLPLKVSSSMMGWAWKVVAPKLSRQKRAMAHLRASFPEKSEQELYAITLGMWENLGRTFAEGLLADEFLGHASSFFEQPEGYDDLVARINEVGGIIVSLHSGNWELGGVVSMNYGFDASVVIQRLKNPLVHDYMIGKRAATFRGGVFSKGDRAGLRIMSSLKGGTVAAIMADLRDIRGVKVPFFGRPAPTNSFPARLARQSGAPLVAIRILRKGGVHFEILVEEIKVPHTDDAEADVYEGTAAIQAVFERWIRDVPEQWMWAHKRWG